MAALITTCLRFILLTGLVIGFAVSPAVAKLQIHFEDCDKPIQLVVQNQPLSTVLSELARTLNFKLTFNRAADRQVSATLEGSPLTLLQKLTLHDNTVLLSGANQKCPSQAMPLHLWVMSEGSDTSNAQLPLYVNPDPPLASRQAEPPDESHNAKHRNRRGRAHRKDMTPEERYNERIRRRLHKDGAKMVSQKEEEQ